MSRGDRRKAPPVSRGDRRKAPARAEKLARHMSMAALLYIARAGREASAEHRQRRAPAPQRREPRPDAIRRKVPGREGWVEQKDEKAAAERTKKWAELDIRILSSPDGKAADGKAG